MDNNFDVAIEYSDTQADWDEFISLMVGKFKQWQKERENSDD